MGVDMLMLDSQVSYLTPPFVHKQLFHRLNYLDISVVLNLNYKVESVDHGGKSQLRKDALCFLCFQVIKKL